MLTSLESLNIAAVKTFLIELQQSLCQRCESFDTEKFVIDNWQNGLESGGSTRILFQGHVFERAGVNFSHVFGEHLPPTASSRHPHYAGASFQAMGVSVVLHPLNPYVPTAHFNLRFFVAQKKDLGLLWWFGGGYDLTPYYGFVEDCQHWHATAKNACLLFNPTFYSRYKQAADEYFYLKHRQEPRGIGGIFFDDLNDSDMDFQQCFDFIRTVGESFLIAYFPIVERRKDMIYGEREREFQNYRRGRYVEFNLLYDRGTLFGLQSGGRTESILMSLPPQAHWRYRWDPPPHSEEERLYKEFLIKREWV